MWVKGENADIDDDLMVEWLIAVLKAARRGITGDRLRDTVIELVDHLSAGKRAVRLVTSTPAAPQETAGEAVAWQRQDRHGQWLDVGEDYLAHYRDKMGQSVRALCVCTHPTPAAATTDNTRERTLQHRNDFLRGKLRQAEAAPTDNTALVEALANLIGHSDWVATHFDIHYALLDEAKDAHRAALASRPAEVTSRERVEAALDTLMNVPLEPSLANHVRLVAEGVRAALTPKASDAGEAK